MRRVAIIASASGNGKTTLGRAVAQRLGVPFVELDALVHGPGWTETPDAELRALVEPVVRSDGWVIDGTYQRKLGSLVVDAADTIVWLDLPMRVWIRRLLRRTARRLTGRESLWNDNRETLRVRSAAATRCSATRCACTSCAGGRGRLSWRAIRSCAFGRCGMSSAGWRAWSRRRDGEP